MAIIPAAETGVGVQLRKKLGDPADYGIDPRVGIWQQRKCKTKVENVRMKFYVPYDPKTEPQQTNREKFAAAVAAWQALTPEEKESWNVKAKRLPMFGYNLFIKQYMYG